MSQVTDPTTKDRLMACAETAARRTVLSDADDLPGLAALHEALEGVHQCAAAAERSPESVGQLAGTSLKLVERIILREVTDTAEAMDKVTRTVSELLALVGGAAVVPPPQTEPVAASEFFVVDDPAGEPGGGGGPAPAAAHAVADESPVSAEDLPLVLEFCVEARGHLEAAEADLLRLESAPDDAEALNSIFRRFHTIKGVAGFLNVRQVTALAHEAENLLDLARKGKHRLAGASVDAVLDSVDVTKRLIDALQDAAGRAAAPPPEPRLAALLATLRACASGSTAAPAATPAAAATEADAPHASPAAPAEVHDAPPAAAPPAAPGVVGGTSDATVKVATDRLDALINMVGELVIAQSMVAQDVKASLGAAAGGTGQRLGRNMSHLGKLTRELQDLSMSMRMVPIQATFQKMARLVRDLAKKAGKEIEFGVVGGDTELDRNVVEAISDPLVHMVRNSADHGVEQPDDRERAGKPTAGRVELRARHQAGKVVIEIEDDGRGLNKAKIVRKAVAAGIVREGEPLTDQQVFQLIFHAGLSTAEKVTDVSGRGVGMDVVKRNVEALRGRIDIASTEGKGTRFTIQLPLTLAVIDGLVVRVGGQRYIVPITSIEQSLRPTAAQLSTVQGRGEQCMVRGNLLTLFRLHRLFAVGGAKEDPAEALVVIVQDHSRRCCLLVDEVLGQQQVVIKSLGDGVGAVPGVSGGAILGDGSVSLILDVPGLIELATEG